MKKSIKTKLYSAGITLALGGLQLSHAVVLIQDDFTVLNGGTGFSSDFMPTSQLNTVDPIDTDVSIVDGVYTTTGTSFTSRNFISSLSDLAAAEGVTTLYLGVDFGLTDGGSGFAGISLFTGDTDLDPGINNETEHLLIGRLPSQRNHHLSVPGTAGTDPVLIGEGLARLVVELDLANNTATLFGNGGSDAVTGELDQVDLNSDLINQVVGPDLGATDQFRIASAGNGGGRELVVDNFIIATTAEGVGAVALVPEPSSTLLLGLGSLSLILRRRRS